MGPKQDSASPSLRWRDPHAVISVTEVNLARVPRALEGEVKGGSSLEGAGKGRLWRKGSHKEID